MLAAAEAEPGSVKYGITGAGNSSHLGPAQMALEAGVDMPHVVFDGGSSLMTALLGGHIPAAAGSPVDYKDQISAGAVPGLVTFAAERSVDPVLADIPTAQELGYDIQVASWTGVSAPAGIPEEVAQRLEAAFAAAMADDEVQQAIRDLGSDPEYLDSADFAQRWSDAGERWTAIVTDTTGREPAELTGRKNLPLAPRYAAVPKRALAQAAGDPASRSLDLTNAVSAAIFRQDCRHF